MNLRIEDYSITISPEHLALLMELWIRVGFVFPHGVSDHSVIRLALEDLISRGDLVTLQSFLTRSGLNNNAEAFSALSRMAASLPASYNAAAFTARHDPNASFEYIDGPEGAEALIVIFTGNVQRVGFPLPMVHGLFETTGCPILYLKDKTRSVFCNGLGDGSGRAALIARIRDKMDRAGIRRSILVGSSSGTYAALHYARALSASHVMGLAGPTRLDAADTRPRIQDLCERFTAAELPLDATKGFGADELCLVRYYFGEEHPRDADHARHLVKSGAGETVAVRGHANHVVLDVISSLGLFQADLAAAVAGGEFTDPLIHPELIFHPKTAP